MQYLVSAPPDGAPIAAGSSFAADAGAAATIMLKTATNALCAISFLLERQRWHVL